MRRMGFRLWFLAVAVTGSPALTASSNENERPLTIETVRELVAGMPELKQWHAMLDNEYSAYYEALEQLDQGIPIVGLFAEESSPIEPFDLSDVRLSNSTFDGSQNEFQIAINPIDPMFAIGTANDSRFGGIGIYRTETGGLSWTAKDAPTSRRGCCDPSVVYGRDGIAYAGLLAGGGQITFRSPDNGATWVELPFAPLRDRPNLAVDPRNSLIVYITFSDVGASNRIKGYRSTDGGNSWGAPFFIGANPPAQGYQQASQPRVAFDGTLYVGYQQYRSQDRSCADGVENVLAVSTDAAASFRYTTLDIVQGGACTSFQGGRGTFCINAEGSNFRSRSHPILGLHPINRDIVYMIYSGGDLELPYTCGTATGRHSDILFRRSLDGGATFSDPIRVNQDPPGSDQYFPWMEVASDGTIWVGWNDRREDPLNFKSRWYQAVSLDEGNTWTEMPVASVITQPASFIGDYHGLSATMFEVMGMWFDTRNSPSGDPYTRPISTCSPCNLEVTGAAFNCGTRGHWQATVHNRGDCTVVAPYSTVLQVRADEDDPGELTPGHHLRPIQDVAQQSGSTSFPPGSSVIEGDFCDLLGPDLDSVRIRYAVNPDNSTCRSVKTTGFSGSCPGLSECNQ